MIGARATKAVATIPRAGDPVTADYVDRLDRFDRLADLLDSRYRIPLTSIRFGWDPVVGMVPVAGDIVMAVISLRLIDQARRLGADPPMLTKMALNVGIDLVFGSIPFVGPVFDLFFRSNLRNLKLLTDEIERRRRPPTA